MKKNLSNKAVKAMAVGLAVAMGSSTAISGVIGDTTIVKANSVENDMSSNTPDTTNKYIEVKATGDESGNVFTFHVTAADTTDNDDTTNSGTVTLVSYGASKGAESANGQESTPFIGTISQAGIIKVANSGEAKKYYFDITQIGDGSNPLGTGELSKDTVTSLITTSGTTSIKTKAFEGIVITGTDKDNYLNIDTAKATTIEENAFNVSNTNEAPLFIEGNFDSVGTNAFKALKEGSDEIVTVVVKNSGSSFEGAKKVHLFNKEGLTATAQLNYDGDSYTVDIIFDGILGEGIIDTSEFTYDDKANTSAITVVEEQISISEPTNKVTLKLNVPEGETPDHSSDKIDIKDSLSKTTAKTIYGESIKSNQQDVTIAALKPIEVSKVEYTKNDKSQITITFDGEIIGTPQSGEFYYYKDATNDTTGGTVVANAITSAKVNGNTIVLNINTKANGFDTETSKSRIDFSNTNSQLKGKNGILIERIQKEIQSYTNLEPKFVDVTTDGTRVKVNFNEDIVAVNTSHSDGSPIEENNKVNLEVSEFSVMNKTKSEKIDLKAVNIEGSSITIELMNPLTESANIGVTYTGSNKISDLEGKLNTDFTGEKTVEYLSKNDAKPTFISSEITSKNTITLKFSEEIKLDKGDLSNNKDGFIITDSGNNTVNLISAEVDSDKTKVVLTTENSLKDKETYRIVTKSGLKIKDNFNQEMDGLINTSVTYKTAEVNQVISSGGYKYKIIEVSENNGRSKRSAVENKVSLMGVDSKQVPSDFSAPTVSYLGEEYKITSIESTSGMTQAQYNNFIQNADNNITSIGPNAFAGSYITDVKVTDTITSISSDAFKGSKVEFVELGNPSSKVEIPAGTFTNVKGIKVNKSSINDKSSINNKYEFANGSIGNTTAIYTDVNVTNDSNAIKALATAAGKSETDVKNQIKPETAILTTATLSPVEIKGEVGKNITNATFTISLNNGKTFNSVSGEITSWFKNNVGLTFEVVGTSSGKDLTVKVSGNPNVASTENLKITIPSDKTNNGNEIVVTPVDYAKFNVTGNNNSGNNNGGSSNNGSSSSGSGSSSNSNGSGSASIGSTPSTEGTTSGNVTEGTTEGTTKELTFNNIKLPTVGEALSFTDVPTTHWANSAISRLSATGVINGMPNGSFNATGNSKRADVAIMLTRLLGLSGSSSSSFADVPANAYYANAVGLAKDYGIINGTSNGNFNPNGNITRQDTMVMIDRILEKLGISSNADTTVLGKFADTANISGYALQSVARLVNAGVINGNGGKINPTAPITRAEIAVIMDRVYNIIDEAAKKAATETTTESSTETTTESKSSESTTNKTSETTTEKSSNSTTEGSTETTTEKK